MRKVAEENI